MAEKPKVPVANSKQPQQPKSGLLLKIMVAVIVLLILIGIGFAAGVYLKFFDTEKLAKDLNLSKYPVIGGFFPKTNFETVELPEDSIDVQAETPLKSKQTQTLQPQQPPLVSQPINPNLITKEELEKQAKLKQQGEAKRISKLARLYGGMKPDEAIAIMQELDDSTVLAIFSKMEEEQVSKILALFDSKRAARLTQDMLKGQDQLPSL